MSTTPPAIGRICSHRSLFKFGRKRKEGNRPHRKPPTWDHAELAPEDVAALTMKYMRNAIISSPRSNGLQLKAVTVAMIYVKEPYLLRHRWPVKSEGVKYSMPPNYPTRCCEKEGARTQGNCNTCPVLWKGLSGVYLLTVSKFRTRSAMKRPIMPKTPPLAPCTVAHLLSKAALKKLPAHQGCSD